MSRVPRRAMTKKKKETAPKRSGDSNQADSDQRGRPSCDRSADNRGRSHTELSSDGQEADFVSGAHVKFTIGV